MERKDFAIIDIGSNSIRLVVFKVEQKLGYYKEIQNLKVVARLSSHFDTTGNITCKGIETLIKALENFQKITRTYRNLKVECVATAAIRQAKNQLEIIDTINQETDFTVKVLSEYDEAYFGYLAVVNSTNLDQRITIDIGGGSTEITLFKNRKMVQYHSFPFGAITLKQRFIHHEIPTKTEVENLKVFLVQQFESLKWLKGNNNFPVIGIGGSARNLSLIHQRSQQYPLSGLHQYTIAKDDINQIKLMLKGLPLKKRHGVNGLSKDRSDIIIPAIEAIYNLMQVSNSTQFIMSNKGLRDGIFYHMLLSQSNIPYFENVAEESFTQLAQEYEINLKHVTQTSYLASMLFEEITKNQHHNLTHEDASVLLLSARVLYIGEFINAEASSEHTFYLLTNRSIDGLNHFERLKIALIASFKSKSSLEQYAKPFLKWLTVTDLAKIELLGSILKFANSLNRTRRNVVKRIELVSDNETVHVQIRTRDDAFFEEQQASKHKKHLEKALNKKVKLIFSKEDNK